MLAANTAGRARATVREHTDTRSLGQAARKVRHEHRSNMFPQSVPNAVGRKKKSSEHAWRDWVKKDTNLPTGSLSAQTLEQLTMSGLARDDGTDLENHLRVHRCLGKTFKLSFEKFVATIYCEQSPHPMDTSAAAWRTCQACGSQTHQRKVCWYTDGTCRKSGWQARTPGRCVLD